MSEYNQEGYQTLGWIINKSEYGLFLVVADEAIQKEIVKVYQQGMVGLYDYRQHSGSYYFQNLKKWIDALPRIQTFFIVNFQFAIQNEQDLNRLNFSRDMLAGLGKNLIFLITPYGDDKLAANAYDFYSFIKIRVTFYDYMVEGTSPNLEIPLEESLSQEEDWNTEEIKEKLQESYSLMQLAKEAGDMAKYQENIKLLLQAKDIREKVLGTKHLETADVYEKLAEMYKKQGKYKEAEELYKKALSVCEEVLGEKHPDTATSYNNLAVLYEKQGKYKEAKELYEKVMVIRQKMGDNQ